jgi:copper homeostasis protein (lipoprotein)
MLRTGSSVLAALALASVACAGLTQEVPPSGAIGLIGTSWQLVKFEGGNDKVLTPGDKSRYTLSFPNDGAVAVRIDCNRGHGTWKSDGPNRLQFGPLALTRAMCPAGELNDRLVKDWQFVRSYLIKDGHLFLSLMADGGIYEFEPMSTERSSSSAADSQTADQPFLSRLPATFTGTLPCADCPGINYQLNLLSDHTFSSRMVYEDRNASFNDQGSWDTGEDGKILSLRNSHGAVQKYAMQNDATLRQLDSEEHEITSQLNYNLKRSPEFMPLDSAKSSDVSLENTEWELVELNGNKIDPSSNPRKAYFVLNSEKRRVSGSGGCNRLAGNYELNGEHLKFDQMAGTMMACPQGMETEAEFLHALASVSVWKVEGKSLELLDNNGKSLARFTPKR